MDNIIKALIVEDHQESSDYLYDMVTNTFPEIRILAREKTITGALQSIAKYEPSLVFLDIDLEDGLSFAILDKTVYTDFEVVFTTGYDMYYQKAFEYCAFNYLLKPINKDALTKVIEKFKRLVTPTELAQKNTKLSALLNQENPRVIINLGDENIFVPISDIILCEADGSYCEITVNEKKYLTSKPLKYYEELFENKSFFKANRSVLVNILHITRIHKKETIVLSNKKKVTVSVRNKSLLSELMSNFS
ncbi:MAG: response regulator transcription factor [Flavobacteriaceae bacterium]|nr:response regulator transcription factor [Flavobacteriaceae bacterium]